MPRKSYRAEEIIHNLRVPGSTLIGHNLGKLRSLTCELAINLRSQPVLTAAFMR